MNGIFNVIKPTGMSSNLCVSKIKRKFNIKKVGHLGTLDPDASGVLPICVGKATRLFDYFLKKNKVYRAIFVFGKETDTLDSEGTITQTNQIPNIDNIQQVMNTFLGEQEQMPPKYSAKKVNGKNAYELSRNGEDFELKPKKINIIRFDLIKVLSNNMILVEIECSSGTYVRSLARDLAQKLNTCSYVGAIIRVSSGMFQISEAKNLEDIAESDIISNKQVLSYLNNFTLSEKEIKDLYDGKIVKTNISDCENIVLVSKNEVLAICSINEHIIKIKINLREEI